MAEAASSVAPNAELLEWPKKDNRRFLHVVYRVGDLDRTIKYGSLSNNQVFVMIYIFHFCYFLLFFLLSGFILKLLE